MSNLVQMEGEADRLHLNIDGTMADAQDQPHPYIKSTYGTWCRVCGLSVNLRNHQRWD
jgi:hypothetical protein